MLPNIYQILRTSNAVKAIVGTSPSRIYRHESAPQDTTKPYITWFIITGVPQNTLSETPNIDAISIQVDCWHQTDAGVESMAIAVRDAMETVSHMTSIVVNEREPETKLYRIGLQFDVWLDR
jgi:hypothetical protein